MIRASVVFPLPGGPCRIIECGRSPSTARRRAEPGARRRSWPTNSSSERGRMRVASGASGDAGAGAAVPPPASSSPNSRCIEPVWSQRARRNTDDRRVRARAWACPGLARGRTSERRRARVRNQVAHHPRGTAGPDRDPARSVPPRGAVPGRHCRPSCSRPRAGARPIAARPTAARAGPRSARRLPGCRTSSAAAHVRSAPDDLECDLVQRAVGGQRVATGGGGHAA